MKNTNTPDSVDDIINQWNQEKPGLDLSAMEIIGRLKKCEALMQPKLEVAFKPFGLCFWEFDVLATLLRSGTPYCMAPTALFSSLMITSGTMTHRMTQLEKKGLIERVSNEADARSKLVKLSESGYTIINSAVEAHVANELDILSSLDSQQQLKLNDSLRTLLSILR